MFATDKPTVSIGTETSWKNKKRKKKKKDAKRKKKKKKKFYQVKGKDSLQVSKLHQRRTEVIMNVFTQLFKYTNTVVVQMKWLRYWFIHRFIETV